MKTAIKIMCLALFLSAAGLASLSLLAPMPLHAQVQISTSIPGTPITDTSPPSTYISNFYVYALSISGILAFGIIVFGGVKYMVSAGNPSAQGDAKEWIKAAILGLLLLASAYIILNLINPDLVTLGTPGLSPTGIIAPTGGGGNGGGSSGQPTAKCQPPANGPCSLSQLSQYSCLGSNTALAAGVCNVESSGNALAGGDLSTNVGPNGKKLPASVGLFQINLSANTIKDANGNTLNCPAAFSNPFTGSNPHTTIVNMNLYNQCVAAAENPALNVAKACQLSKNGTSWSLWGPATRAACNV